MFLGQICGTVSNTHLYRILKDLRSNVAVHLEALRSVLVEIKEFQASTSCESGSLLRYYCRFDVHGRRVLHLWTSFQTDASILWPQPVGPHPRHFIFQCGETGSQSRGFWASKH